MLIYLFIMVFFIAFDQIEFGGIYKSECFWDH